MSKIAKFISALKEDQDRISDIVHDDIKKARSFATARIMDGGMRDFNDNDDTIEYTVARPAFYKYRNVDATPRELIEGQQPGRGFSGTNQDFTTQTNEQDPNACHGSCEFKFGQGFKTYTTFDKILPLHTPEVCAMDYIRMGKPHVKGYFKGLFTSYREYGTDNFEAELQNSVIEYGGANGSVLGADHFNLTRGQFEAPPQYRMSIHYLREYRTYMIREGGLSETGLLEIEMPRQDWLDAVAEDQIRRNGMQSQASFNSQIFKDERGPMLGREFHVYDGIKCFFNEMPVRGYFRPAGIVDGKVTHDFVRVYHWINVVNEDGGVSAEPNHDYDRAYTVGSNGQRYPMVTFAFVINPKSFKRYGLNAATKFAGSKNVPANFKMEVLDGPWIPNNRFNDKFQIVSRHMYRFKVMKSELSGAIAYRHSRPEGYVIVPVEPDPEVIEEQPSGPEQFAECGPDAGEAANCVDCGQVSDDQGTCVDVPADIVFGLKPAVRVETLFTGDTYNVQIEVVRKGSPAGAVDVTYAVTAAGAAIDATHFTAQGATVLNFADGETSKFVDIEILGVAGLDEVNDGATLTLSAPSAGTSLEDTDVDVIILDGTPA